MPDAPGELEPEGGASYSPGTPGGLVPEGGGAATPGDPGNLTPSTPSTPPDPPPAITPDTPAPPSNPDLYARKDASNVSATAGAWRTALGIAKITEVVGPTAIRVVAEGDSNTVGYDIETGEEWPSVLAEKSYFSGRSTFFNVAANGNTLADITSQYASQVYPLRPAANGGVPTILIVVIGANDTSAVPSTYITSLESYWQQAKDDGFIVWGVTIADRENFPTRLPLNDLIRKSLVPHKVLDMALIVDRYSDTSLVSDNIHWTARGQELFADLADSAAWSPSRLASQPLSGDMGGQNSNDVNITGGTATFTGAFGVTRTASNTHVSLKSETSGYDSGLFLLRHDDLGMLFEYSPANGKFRISNFTSGGFIESLAISESSNIATFNSGVIGAYFQTNATYADDAAAAAATPTVPIGGWYARTSDNAIVRRAS